MRDDAHVYSNIGGIDLPTYFSELTHCSLNWEVEVSALFKAGNIENLNYTPCLWNILINNIDHFRWASRAYPVLGQQVNAILRIYDFINRKPSRFV